MRFILIIYITLHSLISINAQKSEKQVIQEFELKLEFEQRYFYEEGLYGGQEKYFPSLALTPEYKIDWNSGYESINFKGFFRLDKDDNRTHWDIRELYYQKAKDSWEINIGMKKIFWGVTESNHLVDIINQTDAVESFDGESKLGQPLVQFTYTGDKLGTFDLFYLPYHRKRIFPGQEGRLRFPSVIDENDLEFESNSGAWKPGVAIRWGQYFGISDIGLSYYYGNGREPLFVFNEEGRFNAIYPTIHQLGLELQITHDAYLWKLESIYRSAENQNFFALTAGLEYTFSNLNGKGLDIGILGEYLFDSRDELALNALQNDVFVGSRLGFNDINDTSFLIGGIVDLESGSTILSVEGSRRIGESLTFEIEARIFGHVDKNELILSNFKNDSFIKTALSKYF